MRIEVSSVSYMFEKVFNEPSVIILHMKNHYVT